MKRTNENLLFIPLALIVVFAIAYSSWRVEKWINYKFSYGSQVENQIKPLQKRVDALEKRVSELEKK